MFIRDLCSAWDILHGECDYMELFAMTALRNSNDSGNSIFSFIIKHFPELREKDKSGQDSDHRQNDIYKRYAPIIDWLFPTSSPPLETARRVYNTKPVDYFERIIAEYVREVPE